MYKWYLPTLGEILQSEESNAVRQTRRQHSPSHAERQWYGAIAALNTLLIQDQAKSASHQSSAESPIEILTGESTVGGANCYCSQSISGGRPSGGDPRSVSHQDSDCIHQDSDCISGLILSGPFPVLSTCQLRHPFAHWTVTGDPTHRAIAPLQLPSAEAMATANPARFSDQVSPPTLSLHPDDPLAAEPFCLVLTSGLSLVLTLSVDANQIPQFFFSFDPDIIWQGWRALKSRLQLTHPSILPVMKRIAHQFAPTNPDYHKVMEFSQLMLMHTVPDSATDRTSLRRSPTSLSIEREEVADTAPQQTGQQRSRYPSKPLNINRTERQKLHPLSWQDVVSPETSLTDTVKEANSGRGNARLTTSERNGRNNRTTGFQTEQSSRRPVSGAASPPQNEVPQPEISSDVELLKALAHEVRTPLTTIRTLTRLLLRRKGLEAIVMKRLQQIDRECTKQIDRFSLIFKAVELKTTPEERPLSPLATISLSQVFQENVARWQQQAQQRNLTLKVVLPNSIPNVMSDPTMLDQVLTGLMDRMTHTLPAGTLIQLSVVPAGNQLKLQFWAKPQSDSASTPSQPSQALSGPTSDTDLETGSAPPHCRTSIFAPTLQAVGQLLMFQPETGNLSLNLDVTKNLFQFLGGKLIVRHTPQKGEVLTIFLPLEGEPPSGLSKHVVKGDRFC